MIIIIILSLKLNSIWLAGGLAVLALVFLLGEFFLERYKLAKTEYRPPYRPKEIVVIYRKLGVGLLILNLAAILILLFPPNIPSDPIAALWPLFLYTIFFVALVRSSLGYLGREVARSKYIETES